MKHTPGPWAQHTPSGPADTAVIVRELPDHRRTVVAVIPGHYSHGKASVTDWDEAHANARLVAAAPEMLIALECALRAMENQCHRDGIDPQTDTTCAIVRNTINKATKGA